MGKKLIVALIGAMFFTGCQLGSDKNRVYYAYLDAESYFDSYTDIKNPDNGYKFLTKIEVPIREEYIVKQEDELRYTKMVMTNANPARSSYYKDMFERERKKLRDALSAKRTLESYMRIISTEYNPTVAIYQRLVVEYKGESASLDDQIGYLTKVKFNCQKSDDDMIVAQFEKSFSNTGSGKIMAISQLLEPININGGQRAKFRFYFNNNKYLDSYIYYSKEQAKQSAGLFDKAKQIVCKP